jgi:Protein of unknown function (DUF2878)
MNKKLIFNALGFNVVWFALALGAPANSFIVPVFLSLLFIVFHLVTSQTARQDVGLIGVCIFIGFGFDSFLQTWGWVQFAAPNPSPFHALQPWWMTFLWAAFACTLNYSLAWMRFLHWFFASLLSGLFGCFSYFGAMKLGALQLATGDVPIFVLFCFWATFMPLVQKMKK